MRIRPAQYLVLIKISPVQSKFCPGLTWAGVLALNSGLDSVQLDFDQFSLKKSNIVLRPQLGQHLTILYVGKKGEKETTKTMKAMSMRGSFDFQSIANVFMQNSSKQSAQNSSLAKRRDHTARDCPKAQRRLADANFPSHTTSMSPASGIRRTKKKHGFWPHDLVSFILMSPISAKSAISRLTSRAWAKIVIDPRGPPDWPP